MKPRWRGCDATTVAPMATQGRATNATCRRTHGRPSQRPRRTRSASQSHATLGQSLSRRSQSTQALSGRGQASARSFVGLPTRGGGRHVVPKPMAGLSNKVFEVFLKLGAAHTRAAPKDECLPDELKGDRPGQPRDRRGEVLRGHRGGDAKPKPVHRYLNRREPGAPLRQQPAPFARDTDQYRRRPHRVAPIRTASRG